MNFYRKSSATGTYYTQHTANDHDVKKLYLESLRQWFYCCFAEKYRSVCNGRRTFVRNIFSFYLLSVWYSLIGFAIFIYKKNLQFYGAFWWASNRIYGTINRHWISPINNSWRRDFSLYYSVYGLQIYRKMRSFFSTFM